MEWYLAFTFLVGLVLASMALGIPVAFAFLLTNMIGAYMFMGGTLGLNQVVANAGDSIATFILAPLPLFVLMGELFFHSGLAARVFDSLDLLFGRVQGRLSYLTIAGGTVFAALSGSSLANTAMLGSMMTPEMNRRGYKPHMAVGPIMAAGGLGMIIPPSTLAVLFGSIAEIDIGALLIAGLLPGLGLAAMYAVVVALHLWADPTAAPAYEGSDVSVREALVSIAVNVLPMSFVVFCVVGLILLGVATPTEAAAFGVLSVAILCLIFRVPLIGSLRKALLATVRVSAAMGFIIMGSAIFSQLLAFSGATAGLAAWTTDLQAPHYVILFAMLAVLLLLGMFMEQVSIMMLTVPVFMPVVVLFGYDTVWFGMLFLLVLEIGLVTPPLGLGLFVMLSVSPAKLTLMDVSRAALPYVACAMLMVAIIYAFPGVALYLPSLIR